MVDFVVTSITEFLGYCYSILAGLGKYAFTVELGEALDVVDVAVAPILVSQGNPFTDYVFVIRKANGNVILNILSWLLEKLPVTSQYYDYPVWIGLLLLFVTFSALIAIVNFVKSLLP